MHHKLDISFRKNQMVKFQWGLEQLQLQAIIQKVSAILSKPLCKCIVEDRQSLIAAQFLLLHSTQMFIYKGQLYFVFQNHSVAIINHPPTNTPAVQEEAYTSAVVFTGHILQAHGQSRPQREAEYFFCMGCQVLLLKPSWTRVCIPDFCSHWSCKGSKAVYSFGLVSSTSIRFQ